MFCIHIKNVGTKILHPNPALRVALRGAVSPAPFTTLAARNNAAIVHIQPPTTNTAPALAPTYHRSFSALSLPIVNEEQGKDQRQFSALSPNLAEILRAEFEV